MKDCGRGILLLSSKPLERRLAAISYEWLQAAMRLLTISDRGKMPLLRVHSNTSGVPTAGLEPRPE